MSISYRPVIWNRTKMIYDAVLLAGIMTYILVFLKVGPVLSPALRAVDLPTQRMRAFGSLALLMITLVLAIGPLARIDTRFMPLLYNRRHFGVLTAIIAATHASYVLGWYFALARRRNWQRCLPATPVSPALPGFPLNSLASLRWSFWPCLRSPVMISGFPS